MADNPPARSNDRAHCPRCGGSFSAGFRVCPYDGVNLIVGTDPLLGTTLVDRYIIDQVLGEGALGRVYLARHLRIARRVAIKVPSAKLAGDARIRKRFLRELAAAAQLDHPNVVGISDYGETPQGMTYLVMDYAQGDTLAQHLALKRSSVDETLGLIRQIALGLEHAHERGVVHHDLRPDNIIVERRDGRPRIADFGLGALRDGASAATGSGGMATAEPHYQSPEQAGGDAVDFRSDLYSLGVITYEALAGVRPFDGPADEIARKVVHARVPMFRERAPRLVIPPAVENLCRRMLEKRPEIRTQSARAVVHSIDTLLGTGPRPPGAWISRR